MRFKIPVVRFTELTCPIYEPPENGALIINYFGSDPLCQVQCKRGYDFVTIPPQLYICATGVWQFSDFFNNADTSLPWPDCAREYYMANVSCRYNACCDWLRAAKRQGNFLQE